VTRIIPEILERVYRLRHHDFAGLDSKTVAKMLGVTQHCNVYVLREYMGMSHPEVEQHLGMCAGQSGAMVHFMCKKGMYFQPDIKHRVDTYSTWMDYKVMRKF
jgi:hypothetical protein